jgi:hypothetical protein
MPCVCLLHTQGWYLHTYIHTALLPVALVAIRPAAHSIGIRILPVLGVVGIVLVLDVPSLLPLFRAHGAVAISMV